MNLEKHNERITEKTSPGLNSCDHIGHTLLHALRVAQGFKVDVSWQKHTWMSQEVSEWLVSGLQLTTPIYPIYK